MHVVITLHPVTVQYAVFEHAVLLHRMEARFLRNRAFRQFPHFFGNRTVFRVSHHHVGWQTVCKGTHFTRRTTG
ncbi:Uncharacterised protein [Vibrio cholerae]|uniref:Uncharacterized protein n=1 Tax=Vibrio cholerae TaxID=666 RepID=A0A655WI08_VIBCL|nr:Uncharacterised protein [Vibrio cholerae]CSB90685.1 Uncharacterised protein [Vibrio cholerae]CSC32726.1 Uncharacterised protein [Vibrio cholerae]CSD31102.1 Uncharacterised protein [Vibrio cholerae]